MNSKFKYIRLHRKSLNINQQAYAERYGVTQGLVSAIERGDRNPPKNMAIDCVAAFSSEISLGDLNPIFSGLIHDVSNGGGIVNTN